MERLLGEVGRYSMRAGLDAWSPWLPGEDLAAAARRMASRTNLSIAAHCRKLPRWAYEPQLVDYRRELRDAVGALAMGGWITPPSCAASTRADTADPSSTRCTRPWQVALRGQPGRESGRLPLLDARPRK